MKDDVARAALAEALAKAVGCRGVSLHGPGACRVCRANADALLPTVRRIVAAELRAAADWIWDGAPARSSASAELHARADDLEALDTPDHGKA